MTRDKKYIIGNFKMNLTVQEASLHVHALSGLVQPHRNVEVVLAPSMIALQSLSLQVNRRQFKLAAQNFYWRDSGAFTGEVSATQLRGVADYGLVGHSERRHMFYESDKDTRAKVQAAIRNDIIPVLCIGETASERTDGETIDVLRDQLVGGLANITSEDMEKVLIAYEPVWAIGTGDSATPPDVTQAIRAIRRELKQLYGAKVAEATPILYGGSVTPESAADYLALSEVDGLLVGGASLNARGLSDIIKKAHQAGKR